MRARVRKAAMWGGFAFALLLAVAIGYSLANNGPRSSISGSASSMGIASKPVNEAQTRFLSTAQPSAVDAAGATAGSAAPAPTDRMVVSTASMNVRVADVGDAVTAVRALAASLGGQIENLTVEVGSAPEPLPAQGRTTSEAQPQPSGAQITLRVPAERLAEARQAAAKLGTVLSESSSQDDVTQQHVDMAARLKNLQAEEARLRDFLGKATKVSDMLEVERELSRVRGEIESMQAQLQYLERQAAMATLTLSLTSPGAVVRPSGTDWGFRDAVTAGVQAAASMLRSIVTVSIALAPLVVLGLLVWAAIALIRRRRRPISPGDDDDNGPADV